MTPMNFESAGRLDEAGAADGNSGKPFGET